MRAKALKTKDSCRRQSATDSYPQPGDFPLGSPESRAAARAGLQRRSRLSPYDLDCYALYACTVHLHAGADPDYQWMEKTDFYRRGREVSDELNGPIIPSHLDREYARRTSASIGFEAIHGRLPEPGDVLRYEEIAEFYSAERAQSLVEHLRGVWARRLADTACPFKFENGKMLVRQKDGSWELDWLEDADTHWNNVEDDALERYRRFIPGVAGQPPTIRAVVFIESKDKVRRVKPLEPDAGTP